MFANSLIIYNYTIKKLVHNLKDDLKENSFLFENEMLVRKLEKYSDPFISTTVNARLFTIDKFTNARFDCINYL